MNRGAPKLLTRERLPRFIDDKRKTDNEKVASSEKEVEREMSTRRAFKS